MTITMSIEIEAGASFDKVFSVLSDMKAEYSIDERNLTGNFNYSNCYFVFRYICPHDAVAVDGLETDWEVGMRGAFHSPINALSESWVDIKGFITKFAMDTSLRFILSFQYESVYAIRDQHGLRFLKNMVEDAE